VVYLVVFHDYASLRHGMGMALRVSGPFDGTGFDLFRWKDHDDYVMKGHF
jgi:hypothetical protein